MIFLAREWKRVKFAVWNIEELNLCGFVFWFSNGGIGGMGDGVFILAISGAYWFFASLKPVKKFPKGIAIKKRQLVFWVVRGRLSIALSECSWSNARSRNPRSPRFMCYLSIFTSLVHDLNLSRRILALRHPETWHSFGFARLVNLLIRCLYTPLMKELDLFIVAFGAGSVLSTKPLNYLVD